MPACHSKFALFFAAIMASILPGLAAEPATLPTLDQLHDPNNQLVLDQKIASSAPNSMRITYTAAAFQSESIT